MESNQKATTATEMEMNSGPNDNKMNKETIFMGTWNVRGTYTEGALKNLIRELRKYKIDIAAIQETKQKGNEIIDMEDYSFFKSGGHNRIFGMGFLVSKKLKQSVIDFKPISDRMCYLRLRGKHRKISLINIHAPTEEKDEDEKSEFYEKMEKIYNDIPNYDIKIVLGDCNAKIGKEIIYMPTIGGFSKHDKSNDNGVRLISFAMEKNMVIRSTQFQQKNIYKGTWRAPNGEITNQIDHVLIEQKHAKCITNIRSYRGADADSDHYLVKIDLKHGPKRIKQLKKRGGLRYDGEKLQAKEVQKKYIEEIDKQLLNTKADNNVEEKWKEMENALLVAAKKTIADEKKCSKKGWFDDTCLKAVDERKKARDEMIRRNTDENKDRYKRRRREAKLICRRKKRAYGEAKIAAIEEKYRNKEIRNFYQEVKKSKNNNFGNTPYYRNKKGKLMGDEEDIAKGWKQYFEELLNKNEEETERQESTEETQQNEIGVEIEIVNPPTRDDIKRISKFMKNNKSAGENGIKPEMIKYGGKQIQNKIHELITEIWEQEEMPKSWSRAMLCPIFKKGDRTLHENYRGIALLDTVYKILATLIKEKLSIFAERVIGDYQCGFRKNRSVTDQIFTMKQIQLNCYEHKMTLYTIFIDFKQAYDSIKRENLYEAMSELEIPTKIIKLTRMTLQNTENTVRVHARVTDAFKTKNGLRQGDPLSATLFNLALELIIRNSGINTSGTIYNKTHQCIAYADDITIVARTQKELQKLIRNLAREAQKMGLEINQEKTKYMVMGMTGKENIPDMNLKVKMGQNKEYNFERVDSFVYLGATITHNSDGSNEVEARISRGNKSVGSLKAVLSAKEVSRNTKLRIYKTVIRPTVTYACETWTLNKVEKEKVEKWERKILRKIYGGQRMGDVWRRRSNEEIMGLYNEPGIGNVIRAQRIRWLGHVQRLPMERTTRKVLRQGLIGTRRRGRPRRRWLDAAEEDLRALNVNGWTDLAKDKQKWRDIVKQALGLQGL